MEKPDRSNIVYSNTIIRIELMVFFQQTACHLCCSKLKLTLPRKIVEVLFGDKTDKSVAFYV